jgi:hypothetical protein
VLQVRRCCVPLLSEEVGDRVDVHVELYRRGSSKVVSRAAALSLYPSLKVSEGRWRLMVEGRG